MSNQSTLKPCTSKLLKSKLCPLVAAIAVTAGCSDKNTPDPIAPQNSGVIPAAQLDTLDKAKNVEGTLIQADRQRREQVDQ